MNTIINYKIKKHTFQFPNVIYKKLYLNYKWDKFAWYYYTISSQEKEKIQKFKKGKNNFNIKLNLIYWIIQN